LIALLITARAFGDFMQALVGTFDRVCSTIDLGGWIVGRDDVVNAVFGVESLSALHDTVGSCLTPRRSQRSGASTCTAQLAFASRKI